MSCHGKTFESIIVTLNWCVVHPGGKAIIMGKNGNIVVEYNPPEGFNTFEARESFIKGYLDGILR